MLVELDADIRFLNEKIGEMTEFLLELENYEIELKKELTRKMMERVEEWIYNF
ncbi:MAG: hypothetical protein QW090_07560 [Candidatus Bathyarchaeia archaeon]